jgi:hypothetical protein
VYEVLGLTDDASCGACTFASRFTLGAAATQGTGCDSGEGRTGASLAYGQGPSAKEVGATVSFGETAGAWTEVGTSELVGDVWSFLDFAGGAAAK